MNTRSRTFSFATAVIVCLPQLLIAADPKSAASKPETRPDADFYLQGEYATDFSADPGRSSSIGVQVIALGDGKFEAVEYEGGLPGNGWNRASPRKYAGETTSAGRAELAGDGRRLVVRSARAQIVDDSGKEIARLRKCLRVSPTMGARPPAGANVLFCGRDAREFVTGTVTLDHFLVAGVDTKEKYGDVTMHLEFRTPYMPAARGQARGNSGVYIQGRYEVQILDSFGLSGADNECGGLYKQRAPLLNMCLPPLTWQTYDIEFTAPKFAADGKKSANARITVRHNGVAVHDDVEITAKTGGGAAEAPEARPLKLQDHGNPVHFRNVWIVEGKVDRRIDDACNVCR
ncbi:MAG: DUF1080 domain-containing protein [Planctomycetia bacterium]|nr:DUF1080 domain-containing protein [Planctomycetia bacterium]